MKSRALALLLIVALAAPAAAAEPPASRVSLSQQTISYGELIAIGSGALVGTSLAAALLDHGLGLVGTLLGAWAGDYYYYRYFTTTTPAAVGPTP